MINDHFDGKKIVIFYKKGTASALDKHSISDSKDVGTTTVFSSNLNGKTLTFIYDIDEGIIDIQTRSRWNIFGTAMRGKLKGEVLKQLVHADHFWFSWAAFKPDTLVYE